MSRFTFSEEQYCSLQLITAWRWLAMAVSHSFWVQWRSMSIGRTCYNVASYFWLAFSFSLTKEINSPRTVREWEGAGQTRIRHWAPNKTTTIKGLKRKKQIHIPCVPFSREAISHLSPVCSPWWAPRLSTCVRVYFNLVQEDL